jgi:hypothetical protein
MEMSADGMNAFEMNEGQSLDDIVSANEKDRRRLSMPLYRDNPSMDFVGEGSPGERRFSTINFGDPNNAMEHFNFEMPSGPELDKMMRSGTVPQPSTEMQNPQTRTNDLAINTQFSNANSPFSTIPQPGSAYASPMHTSLEMDIASPFPPISLPMDMNDPLGMVQGDMNLFSSTHFTPSMMDSANNQDFAIPNPAMSFQPSDQYKSASSSATPDVCPKLPHRSSSNEQSSMHSTPRPKSEEQTEMSQMSQAPVQAQESAAHPTGAMLDTDAFSQINFPWRAPPGGFPSSMHSNPHQTTQFKNVYSSTGFDMLRVLVCHLDFGLPANV